MFPKTNSQERQERFREILIWYQFPTDFLFHNNTFGSAEILTSCLKLISHKISFAHSFFRGQWIPECCTTKDRHTVESCAKCQIRRNEILSKFSLIHCGPVTPYAWYGVIEHDQHWLRRWLVEWRYQTVTWTNADPLCRLCIKTPTKKKAPSQYKDRLIYIWRFPC